MKIYVDAMGGDHAPGEIVKGAIEAVKAYNIDLTLVGKAERIEEELLKRKFDDARVSILNAESVIGFNEEPVKAIRHKKDSSIVVALRAMKGHKDAVLVSAGSTGALLAGGTLILGRIPGVSRPGLGITFPQGDGKRVFLIDVGATADPKAIYLEAYAKLATAYMEGVEGYQTPAVGLINIGTEQEKGSSVVKEAYALLKQSSLNFTGYVEPKDLFTTRADVLVTDGFTGNVIIKTVEGMSDFVFKGIKRSLAASLPGKIGGLLIRENLKTFKRDYDPDAIGGSPLLGVKGGIIKAHGSSKAFAIKNAIHQGIRFAQNNVVEKMMAIMAPPDEE